MIVGLAVVAILGQLKCWKVGILNSNVGFERRPAGKSSGRNESFEIYRQVTLVLVEPLLNQHYAGDLWFVGSQKVRALTCGAVHG